MAYTRTHARDEIEQRIGKCREDLIRYGIKVHDVSLTTRPEPRYIDVTTIGNPYSERVMADYEYGVEYNAVWQVELAQSQVDDFLRIGSHVSHLEAQNASLSRELSDKELALADKHAREIKLRNILKNNPGIKDQWDELMVMMKLAGLDTNLV